jgi:hypothetical protein
MIWKSIARVVKQLNLTVHLVKVKAHSNDIMNDIVDSLAKNAAKHSVNPIKINPHFITSSLGHIAWDNDIVVDQDIRKWCKHPIQAKLLTEINNLKLLDPIRDAIKDFNIDWINTSAWFNHNPDNSGNKISNTFTKHMAFTVKNITHTLPTSDILFRNWNAILAPFQLTYLKCSDCLLATQNNDHIFTCKMSRPFILSMMQTHARRLKFLIKDAMNTEDFNWIELSINRSNIFKVTEHNEFKSSHPYYLLIRNIIPRSLTDLIQSYTHKQNLTRKILFQLLNDITRDVTKFIWRRHVDYIKNFETSHNIGSVLKRAKRKAKNKVRYTTKPTQSKRERRSHARGQPAGERSNRSPMTTNMGDSEQWTASRTDTLDPSFWIHFTSCNILHSGHSLIHFTKNEYESFQSGN